MRDKNSELTNNSSSGSEVWRYVTFMQDDIVATAENSVENTIICYISFRTINFPWFPPYSFPLPLVSKNTSEADV